MRFTPDKHLHSREHLLADDLSRMLLEPKRFGAYLGIARLYDEADLRALARRVLEKEGLDPGNRGRYFFGALRRLEKKPRTKQPSPRVPPRTTHAKTTDRSRTEPDAPRRRPRGTARGNTHA